MRIYESPYARNQRRNRNTRIALVGAAVLAIGAAFYGAAAVDRANGMTVAQSLASAGLGRAEVPARPASLLGRCGGRMMAGTSKASFPKGCAWIEPIRDADALPENCAGYVATIRKAERLAGERPAKTDSALCRSFLADVGAQGERVAMVARLADSIR